MNWILSHRADPQALPLANRHYNRQHPDSPQFVPPGRCLVLRTEGALWVTSWPMAEYVKHDWAGAWVNSCFRRESGERASILIREAVAATLWHWPLFPIVLCKACGRRVAFVSFIDKKKVRQKPAWAWGRCYQKAGWTLCEATTRGGLAVLHLSIINLPTATPSRQTQQSLALEAVSA